MSSLTEIVDGLATRLRTIEKLDREVLTEVRRPSSYPALIIVPPAIPDYGLSLDGQGSQFAVTLLLLTGTIDAEKQHDLLPFLDWTGPASIAAAIQAGRNLGLNDVDARVVSSEPPGLVELPDGTNAYGVALNVQIIAS